MWGFTGDGPRTPPKDNLLVLVELQMYHVGHSLLLLQCVYWSFENTILLLLALFSTLNRLAGTTASIKSVEFIPW